MFNGEISFEIADIEYIDVNLGTEIKPSKIVNKGNVVALGRKAPKYKWIYEIKYDDEAEYFNSLEKVVNQLYEKKEYINQLTSRYEEVSINIYIRSEFAEIGYSIPSHILKKLSLLDCSVNFSILSFGMAIDE
ncbi:MAG: DUF4279 domain-containing protein [Lachnospiraceae bacterium]|nr:DUF4279 domain-containing protein [Lachnospiraceae bacterium]